MNQSLLGELNAVMLAAEQTGLFSSLVTFRDITGATNSSGQVDMSTLVDVAGLVNIPCQLSAATLIRPDSSKLFREPWSTIHKSSRPGFRSGFISYETRDRIRGASRSDVLG